MKSKLETAAADVLLVVDTSDLLHREQHALHNLQKAVLCPWYASDTYPVLPEGQSCVEVMGIVCESYPPQDGWDSIQIVSYWRTYKGHSNVWTMSVTTPSGDPYDTMIDVAGWHPIPPRNKVGT